MDEFSKKLSESRPENKKFKNKLDGFSRKRSESPPDFWMSFPGFVNKGENDVYRYMPPQNEILEIN